MFNRRPDGDTEPRGKPLGRLDRRGQRRLLRMLHFGQPGSVQGRLAPQRKQQYLLLNRPSRPLFRLFSFFPQKYKDLICKLSKIQTQIIGVESEHPDCSTTTTAQATIIF